MSSRARRIFIILAGALIPLLPMGITASAAPRHIPVVIDDDDEPLLLDGSDDSTPVRSSAPARIKSPYTPAAIRPGPHKAAPRPASQRMTPPPPETVETPDAGTEASANVPTGAGPNTPCLHGCGDPLHTGPLGFIDTFGRTLRRAFMPKKVDLLSLTGANMSCAQMDLLKGAQRNVAREFANYNGSNSRCGIGVGDSIRTAGRLFSGGDRVEGVMADFPNSGQYGVLFAKLLPKHGFIRTPARSVDEAPEGSVLVFAGPCSPGHRRSNCDPNSTSDGEKWGHVTIKGSPRLDHGRQWYYTDGRTSWAANKARREFIGAFLPPGSDRGVCQAVHP